LVYLYLLYTEDNVICIYFIYKLTLSTNLSIYAYFIMYIFILFYRDLSVNKLTNIPDYAFVNLTNLIEL